MKRFSFLLIIVVLSSCTRDWKTNPCESDEDLAHQPVIEQIALDAQSNIVLHLNFAYSQEANITVERKTIGGFDPIGFMRLTRSTLMDTSFDKEFDHNFTYRVQVEKNDCGTDYSAEKSFAYVSNLINAPQELQATTLELQVQGIKLEWRDRSNKEDGYKVEKKEGSGYVEIASLPANSQSYIDAIAGIPPLPLQLSYRVKAFNNALSSQWTEIGTTYSGIAVPTNLRITDTTAWHFTIEWQDNSNIETGYLIERNKNGGLFGEIAQLNANLMRYTDTITEIGIYGYRVRAKKDNLYSSFSNEVSHNIKTIGLVAYYPFNGSANDASGRGNNGTVYGAALTSDRFGRPNSAYYFDGIDDYVEVPHSSSLNPNNGSMTIEVWFKTNIMTLRNPSPTYSNILLAKNDADFSNGYAIVFNWRDSMLGSLFTGPDDHDFYFYTFFNDSLNFHQVVSLYNEDLNSLSLYFDGNKKGQTTTNINFINPSAPIMIGRYLQVTIAYLYFKGVIDDIRVYNRALTEAEIQALYHEGGW